MESLASQIIARRNTTKKGYLKDAPIAVNGVTASTTVIPQAQEAAEWGQIAQAAAGLTPVALLTAAKSQAIDIDTPDNSDLRTNAAPAPTTSRVQVDEMGRPMMFDERSETWFPITVNLPGQNQPAPAAPAVPEDEKRKQLIMIFGISLLILLVILYFISRKK
jgi:hypothetical protein